MISKRWWSAHIRIRPVLIGEVLGGQLPQRDVKEANIGEHIPEPALPASEKRRPGRATDGHVFDRVSRGLLLQGPSANHVLAQRGARAQPKARPQERRRLHCRLLVRLGLGRFR